MRTSNEKVYNELILKFWSSNREITLENLDMVIGKSVSFNKFLSKFPKLYKITEKIYANSSIFETDT